LAPLSFAFGVIVRVRRSAYATGRLRSVRVAKPVIVIGNVTVGGTGKTPFVIWLANQLAGRGHRVAIVTRGYGGNSKTWPREVTADSNPREVGDEPVLMAQKSAALVIADPDRLRAAQHAITRAADVILSDDGLQHYRLRRDGEIAVLDGARGLGNAQLLPAGPLREPADRLSTVDLILVNRRDEKAFRVESAQHVPRAEFRLISTGARSMTTGEERTLESFRGLKIHAVAGIGNPPAFFRSLRAAGLHIVEHALADHVDLQPKHLDFGDAAPVLMTEKDAVKCRSFADAHCWSVQAEVQLTKQHQSQVLSIVDNMLLRHRTLNTAE
jgi:tetraacyldisaccharide 4'-kinase